MSAPQQSNWYPTRNQVSSPETLLASFKQLLDQHYALQQQVLQMQASSRINLGAGANALPPGGRTSPGATPNEPVPAAGPPPGSGPTDTQILGLHVLPINPSTLANGATLKYVKKSGNFQFL